MAGFDDTKQVGGRNLIVECGVGPTAFTTAATTVSVPTRLTTLTAALGICVTGGQGAVGTTGAISGNITFTRPAGGTSGDTLQYIAIGY